MSEISLLSSIIKARFDIQEKHSTQFEEYFACKLEASLLAWKERESTFTFLEHSSSPVDIEKALSLTRLLRRADKLIDEITNLNESRKKEQKAPIDIELLLNTRSLEGLIFIETLHDESLITQVARLVNISEKDFLEKTMSIVYRHLDHFGETYQAQVEELEPKNDQESWLAYPCVSCNINKWSQHFDSSTFDFMEVNNPNIDRLLDHVYNEWSVLWQIQDWAQQVHYQGESQDTNRSENVDDHVWHDLFEPFILELATEMIRDLRDQDFIEDLNTCFTSLIDAKRPKDQRVGSFWIDKSAPENITVMFLTRDGKLLAQRDLVWNPQQANSILEAFDIINIRMLTYPEGLDQSYPAAFQLLKTRYQLYPVSSVVLDPVPHPLSLSDNAQKALRIGQRFVAPLRFWARTNLVELMKCFATPQIINCLAESGRLGDLQDRLQDSCAERWLSLRQKRHNRKFRKFPQKYTQADQRNTIPSELENNQSLNQDSECELQKGKLIKATVSSIDGYGAYLVIKNTDFIAHLKLKRKDQVKIGQTIQGQIVAVNPETKVINLKLVRKPKTKSTEDAEQSSNNPAVKKSTLNRLNRLFASN